MRTLRYRVWQLRRALGARLAPGERAAVAATLSPAELALFERMARFDQRHCVDVCQALQARGHHEPALLRAALIHDCGKVADDGRPIPLLYYGVFVVLTRLAPGLYERAARSGRGPLWPFAVHLDHERRAAHLAAQHGSPPAVVGILADYAARRRTAQTEALRRADDIS